MGEAGQDPSVEAAIVREAYAAARELLRRAEEDAAGIRADADRYVQRRQQEAELIVGKARRMLAIAEERAAAMDAGTLGAAAPVPSSAATAPATAVPAWDVEPDVPAAAAIDLTEDGEPVPGVRRTRTELDSILATAVSRAIDRALPSDR